eukprot:2028646-Rhodomonas_salina.2
MRTTAFLAATAAARSSKRIPSSCSSAPPPSEPRHATTTLCESTWWRNGQCQRRIERDMGVGEVRRGLGPGHRFRRRPAPARLGASLT